MAKCYKCTKRKAKRHCPALSQSICTVCCAELRMVELACPESCAYLQDARRSADRRWLPKFVNYLASKDKQELLSVIIQFERIVKFIEVAIVKLQRYRFRDLADEEVLEGVTNAFKTYETRERGIIYEHTSESPRIQAVTRAILDSLEELDKMLEEQQQSSRLRAADILACLDVITERVQFNIDSGNAPQSWVRQSALYLPYPKEESHPLIIG